MRGQLLRTWIASMALSACVVDVRESADESEVEESAQALVVPTDIDVRRSLVVTEQPILARFSFQRVMEQLAAQSHVPGLTALDLFQQWWDTQNPSPGTRPGPHCGDNVDPVFGPVLNDFPYSCRPTEGAQATCNPFVDSACAYVPIALFNRFDLAPEDGSWCGEYRIVYAKQTGQTDSRNRNLIIFEAAMPNPNPQRGLNGCRKIVEPWALLTNIEDIQRRAQGLERFYFEGILNMQPVVHIRHLGDNAAGAGQIRTNQFVQPSGGPSVWSLREFKLRRSADGTRMGIIPVTNKTNLWGGLFAPDAEHELADEFVAAFPGRIASLAASQLGQIGLDVPNIANSGQSEASGSIDTNYAFNFGPSSSPLRAGIQAELTARSIPLTPDDIVARAQTQSCAGCHRLSNNVSLGGGLVWPPSLGFTHVSERDTEVVDGVTRFVISPALINAFLPDRERNMEEYLAGLPPRPRRMGATH